MEEALKRKQYTRDKRDIEHFGGNRELAILRDGERCVMCGMTRDEHKAKYGRDISVDHINGLGRYTPKEQQDNRLENLQTLCLTCHASKDRKRNLAEGRGKAIRKRKLTDEDIRNIRMFVVGGVRYEELAAVYHVRKETIGHIKRGTFWRYVSDTPERKEEQL